MLSNIFVSDPETFYNINFFPGAAFHSFPVAFGWGILFLAAAAVIFFVYRKESREKINYKLTLLIFLCWLPLFFSFYIYNQRDFLENFSYYQYNLEKKRILRMCGLDTVEADYCKIFSFIALAKKTIPAGAFVNIASSGKFSPYLSYYSYPYFKISEDFGKADYLLVYYPIGYFFRQENGFYYIKKDQSSEQVKFQLLESFSGEKLIFKKI